MATQHDLSGDDIRAIRLGLELTQVEAGELIGGGPRAFAKYEAGAVQPSASVRHLLRLLQADPAAIATLRGNGPHPRPAAAISPFTVVGEHVATLTERLFPELLRRLLSSEAQAHDVPADRIHVASNIHASDGGEDGYIAWSGEPDRTRFLPSCRCQFQLKAGAVSPSVAARDVLTGGGKVKDMVRSNFQVGGHYILLTTHRYARKAIERRAAAILKAIQSAGLDVAAHQVRCGTPTRLPLGQMTIQPSPLGSGSRRSRGLLDPSGPGITGAGRPEHDGSPWAEDERLSRLRLGSFSAPRDCALARTWWVVLGSGSPAW